MISGLVHPETKSPRKSKRRKDCPKQKTNKTGRNEDFFPLDTLKSLFNQVLYCSKIFIPLTLSSLSG